MIQVRVPTRKSLLHFEQSLITDLALAKVKCSEHNASIANLQFGLADSISKVTCETLSMSL